MSRADAVWGAIVGATLGMPLRNASAWREISGYSPIPVRMAAHEALDAWVAWAWHRREGLFPEELPETRLQYWRGHSVNTSFGQFNLERGLRPPLSGQFRVAMSGRADALARAVFWGLVLPQQPVLAYRFAFVDASTDDFGGALPAAYLARALAAWKPEDEPVFTFVQLVHATAAYDTRVALDGLLKGLAAGHAAEFARLALVRQFSDGPADAASYVLARVCWALLYGSEDFGRTLGLAVGAGGPADLCGLLAGAILSCRIGIPEDPKWTEPLGTDYVSAMCLRGGLEPPTTIQDFCDLIQSAMSSEFVPEPLPVTTSGSTLCSHGARFRVEYLEGPWAHPGAGRKLVVDVQGMSSETPIEATWQAAEDWELAGKPISGRFGKDTVYQSAAATRIGDDLRALHLRFEDQSTLPIPFVAGMRYWEIGPFPFLDETQLEQAHAAEDSASQSQILMSRGLTPAKWTEKVGPGLEIPTAHLFGGGPGVCFIWMKFRMPQPGRYKLVAAFSPGLLVRIDRRVVIRSFNSDTLNQKLGHLSATFEASGEHELLFKLACRLGEPSNLVFYFLDPEGNAVFPEEFFPLPA